MNTTRIAIADRHPMYVQGIAAELNNIPHFQVDFTAHTCSNLLAALENNVPDVLLLGCNLRPNNEWHLLKELQQHIPNTAILILTVHKSLTAIRTALDAQVKGYLLKSVQKEELIDAVTHVASGKQVLMREVRGILSSAIQNKVQVAGDYNTLTARELEVLKLIAGGCTTQEIANQLGISSNTAATHRKNLMQKLAVKSSVGLVLKAISLNIIQMPPIS